MNIYLYYTTMEFGELLKALLLDLQSLFRFQVSNPDLTLPQILLLSTISDEGVDMSSLSKQMGVDNSTMTRLIDVLIRNGWAIKYKNKKDGRVVMVEITKKGEVLQDEIDKNIDKFGYEIYNSISQEDREEVMEILTEFHWVLSKNLLRSK